MAGQVLDTSAVIAYLYDEDGASIAEEAIFAGTEPALVPFVVMMEVEYKLIREGEDVDERLGWILQWPIRVVESNMEWGHAAARVKAPGRISVADAWVAALALMNDAALVHKDPEFDAVSHLVHRRLPYSRRASR